MNYCLSRRYSHLYRFCCADKQSCIFPVGGVGTFNRISANEMSIGLEWLFPILGTITGDFRKKEIRGE